MYESTIAQPHVDRMRNRSLRPNDDADACKRDARYRRRSLPPTLATADARYRRRSLPPTHAIADLFVDRANAVAAAS
jgi:hypothetical protein